jgi:DNA polymerase-3 subunit alpha
MAFGTLEDLEGSFDLVIFSEPYERFSSLLRVAKDGDESSAGPIPLLVSGTLEAGETPKILVREFVRLDEAENQLAAQLRVRVKEPEVSRDRMIALRRLLGAHPGECEVVLHVLIPGESETVLSLGPARGVTPSDDLRRDVDALFGRPVAECTR